MIAFVLALFLLNASIDQHFEVLMGKETTRWRYVSSDEDQKKLDLYRVLYEKNKNYQFETKASFRIPRDIHLIWLGPRPFPKESVENIRMWVAKHPDWTLHLWTDRLRVPPVKGMVVHMPNEFPMTHLKDHYQQSTNWGQKSDILRYEILFNQGGIYIDHDANCLNSFEGLNRGYDFYSCLEVPHTRVDGRVITSGIGIIGAIPNHPIIKGCIDEVVSHWEESFKLFPLSSPESLRDHVMHSTYLALTRSLEKNLNDDSHRNIVFPASYFYPQKSLKPLYSFHHYGTSWADIENESKLERSIRLSYCSIIKKQRSVIFAVVATLGLILFALWRRK